MFDVSRGCFTHFPSLPSLDYWFFCTTTLNHPRRNMPIKPTAIYDKLAVEHTTATPTIPQARQHQQMTKIVPSRVPRTEWLRKRHKTPQGDVWMRWRWDIIERVIDVVCAEPSKCLWVNVYIQVYVYVERPIYCVYREVEQSTRTAHYPITIYRTLALFVDAHISKILEIPVSKWW